MTTNLPQLHAAAFEIADDTPADVVAEWLDRLQSFEADFKTVKAALKERLVWWIKTTGREIVIGDRRYYVGTPPTTKCLDYEETLYALLETGDVLTVASCLAADAFKHGECQKHLTAEDYARLFQMTRRDVLKDGTAKKEQLLVVDERFVKPRLTGEKS